MINTYQGAAKAILDRAYSRSGIPANHNITQTRIDQEREELSIYDYVCAPSPLVETSLREADVAAERVIPTSFGWSPRRFEASGSHTSPVNCGPRNFIRALFVGSVSVRKGIPELLRAWSASKIKGELVLVGNVESAIQPLVDQAVEGGSVKVVPFTPHVGAYYRSCDMFVFPTVEEGAPQVIFEAAGCGLPIITTPMGAARLVRGGSNGIVVPEGNVDELAAAITALAENPDLRRQFSARVRNDACEFTYDRLGRDRAEHFIARINNR
jgi:glycosyltransferase involved in cell wall biosynthesis